MRRIASFVVALLACSSMATASMAAALCPPATGVALQVLGSGGPIADDGRASSGYVVWVDGASRVMIDAGGGTFLRFGEAQARFEDLDFIGLSHFHTDHSADFPALLKSGFFSGRERALTVAGPSGDGPFPGFDLFLESMIGKQGAYGYLSGYLDGSGGLVKLEASEVSESETIFGDAEEEAFSEVIEVPTNNNIESLTLDSQGLALYAGTNQGHLLRWSLSGLPLPFEGAAAPRSMVGVGNLCDLLIRLGAGGEGIYHVADDRDWTVAELIAENLKL